MMKKKICFQYNGQKYTVDVDRSGDDLVISNEGKTYTVTLLEQERPKAARPAAAAVSPAPAPKPAAASAPRPATPSAPAAPAGAGDLPAPMTGTIKQVKVSKGDAVTKGQLVIVMEAMKMDIEVFAGSAGTIADIYVNPGETVKENQRLLQIS
jgi:glutaconyl-CoA decarboxylase